MLRSIFKEPTNREKAFMRLHEYIKREKLKIVSELEEKEREGGRMTLSYRTQRAGNPHSGYTGASYYPEDEGGENVASAGT